MIDFERGAKVAGRKFYFLTGEDALDELSLVEQFVWAGVRDGYTPVIPPYLVNAQTAEASGITRVEGQFFETTDGLVLIPTAETALVGMHAGEIIPVEDLPLRYVAFSPCFRDEGAYGKRDAGLRRVRQFHKVERFVICRPEESEAEHEKVLREVGDLLDLLGVTWRTVELSEADRPPHALRTVDFEVRAQTEEGEEEWLEVSSVSNTGDWQAKRAQVRFRPRSGAKPIKCHMLNGSALALPRLRIALNAQKLEATI